MRIWHRHRLLLNASLVTLLTLLGGLGCASRPKDEIYLESGKKYLASKDYARAGLQFQNAIQANSDNPRAHFYMGVVDTARGDRAAAYEEIKKALDLNPKDAEAQLAMAELLATSDQQNFLLDARKRAEAIVAESSSFNPDALDALAFTELKLGQKERAEQLLRQATEKAPQHLRSASALAMLRYQRSDREGAEQALRHLVEHSPDSVEAKLILANFYLMIGKNSEGEQLLRAVLKRNPNNELAILDLGTMLSNAGKAQEAQFYYQKLSASADPKYRSLYGSFLFSIGKTEQSITEFERLVKKYPGDPNSRTRMVAAYIAVGRFNDAQKTLARVLEDNPADTAALLQRGDLELIARQYDRARTDVLQALNQVPDSVPARFLLAAVYEATNNELSRRQELNECLRLDRDFLPARIALARSYIFGGVAKSALDVMDQASESQRNRPAVVEQRNWALLALDRRKELQQGIEQGLALGRSRGFLMQAALLALKGGRFAEGRGFLEEILKNNPEDLGALHVLVRSYAAQRQIPAAIGATRKYAVMRPKSAPVQYFLGTVLAGAGMQREAHDAYAAAVTADPRFAPARFAMALMDQSTASPEQARASFAALLSDRRTEIPARMQLSYIEIRAGNYAKAVEHLRKVVEAEPRNVVALNNLAYLLADSVNQPDEALKYAQMAKELAPDDVSVDGTIGWAYFQKRIYTTALKYLETAVDREGKQVANGTAIRRYHLAMAYMKNDQPDRAAKTLSAAMKLDPSLPEAQVAFEMITNIKR